MATMTEAPVTVTLKYGREQESPWIVFKGTAAEVFASILETFKLDPAAWEGFSLHQLVLETNKLADAHGVIVKTFNATPVKPEDQGKTKDATESKPARKTEKKPTAEELKADLIAILSNAPTMARLKQLGVKHKEQIESDADIASAYKARGQHFLSLAK